MPAPKRGRQGRLKPLSVLDAKTKALLCAICHVEPVLDTMAEPTEGQWHLVREFVWRGWVADMRTYSSPGYAPLPYAAVKFDGVPDDVSRVPTFAMPTLAQWNLDQREMRKNRIVPEGLSLEEAQAFMAAWIKEQKT